MAYGRYSQGYPIVEEVAGGKFETITDARLPDQHPRWICPDYKRSKYQEINPMNNITTFASGSQQLIQFNVMTDTDVMIDWSKSFVGYQIRIKKTSGLELTKADAYNATFASIINLTSSGGISSSAGGSGANGATTLSMIYMRNSMCPFSQFQLKDRETGTVIEDFSYINSPALYTECLLTCQPPNFWYGTQSPDQGACESKADLYGATVRSFRDERFYFQRTVYTSGTNTNASNSMTNEGVLPLIMSASTATPASTIDNVGTSSAYTVTFPEIVKQQTELWASSGGAYDGMPLRCVWLSDIMNEPELCYAHLNKYYLNFTLNSYNQAITDLNSVCTAVGNGSTTATTWTKTQNAASFELYNVKLYLYKKVANDNVVQRMMTLASTPSGIEIPFRKVMWYGSNFPHTQTSTTISLNDVGITNLEGAVFMFRPTASVGNSGGGYDPFFFRTMSSGFIADGSSANPPTGAQRTAVGVWSTQGSGTIAYNGVSQVSCRYMSEQLISEQITYILPYQFARMKESLAGLFHDPSDTHISKSFFEGLDQDGFYTNVNPAFCIALNFTSVDGAEKAGISLAKSPCDVTFTINGSAGTTDYQIDYFLLIGATLHVGATSVWYSN
jgi:hypothetical protein